MLENKTTEFKQEYVDDIKKTIIAFANTDGGTLYIGIDDNGKAVGLTDVDDTMLRLSNAIRDSIRPDITMCVDYADIKVEDKDVVKVTVEAGTAKPYYLAKKGIRPEGVFVRQGASSVPAGESAILKMIKETSGDCFEQARSIYQSLTFKTADEVFKKNKRAFGKAQKKTLGLIGTDDMFTNLALILSDQCPYTIKLAVFEGTVKTVFKDRAEMTGSILKQLEDSYDYIDRYNRTRAEFKGLLRIDERDYPIDAIREALLNAVVHRDYTFSASTLISIFDDRIEFTSIGGLVKGVSYDDIMLGVSISRNRNLADIFYKLHLVEAYGTGFMKINAAYEHCNKKPKVEVSNNAFKVTLYNTNYYMDESKSATVSALPNERLDDKISLILKLLRERGSVKRIEVQEALRISQASAVLLLKQMQEKNLIEKAGLGKKTHYVLK